MERYRGEGPTSSFLKSRSRLHVVAAGSISIGLLVTWALWSIYPTLYNSTLPVKETKPKIQSVFDGVVHDIDTNCINPRGSFYDDPSLGYEIGKIIRNWDKKRRDWLQNNPSRAMHAHDRILIVTGSQPSPCKNPIGDHLLLRLFKNKVDYSRINGHDIFYNNALLHPKMGSYWAKISVVRAAMVAHPEAEWIWWVDSDAVFTDMDFQPPMERYKGYNLVVGGRPELIYEKPSWLGLNAGVFYIRNCQWSMEFLEEWAKMGPQTPEYDSWGHILASTIKDKEYPNSDDQTAMVYLLLKQKKLRKKVFLEHEDCIQGYWAGLIGSFDNITNNYLGLEKKKVELRRRHAEKLNRAYREIWEKNLEISGFRNDEGKRPCITHFTGCQPCSGDKNSMYTGDSCWKGIERALNFADNQVLRNYGFTHSKSLDSSSASTLPS